MTKWILVSALIVVVFPTSSFAVDGVIEINQASALAGGVTLGDTPGFPVSINTSGSYRLTSNLAVTLDTHAIQFNEDSISLDLNGFYVTGSPGSTTGGGIHGPASNNSTVRNGSIISIGGVGIRLLEKSRVEDVRVIGFNGTVGIDVGSSSLIANNIVKDVTSHGIKCSRSVVRDNFVGSVGGDGINANECLITGNVLFCAIGYGINGDTGGWSSYSGNNITNKGVCGGGAGPVNYCDVTYPLIELVPNSNFCENETCLDYFDPAPACP